MFESDAVQALSEAVDALCVQPLALADGTQTRALLRALQAGIDRLEGLKAAALDQLDETGGGAEEGASSALGWARRELRMGDAEIKRRRTAGRSMRLIPELGEAVRGGEVRLDHAYEFSAGLATLGVEKMREASAQILLPLARVAGAADVRMAIRRIDELARPERLDEAYKRGMERRNLSVTRCGDGFHVAGFFDLVNGAKLATWLGAASAPRGADDVRTPAQRRLDAFGELIDATLAHGMPSDRGVRPQLHLMADATWLAGQGGEPPRLVGFGSIGPQLFAQLACGADVTPILVDGVTGGPTPQADVLNVGRTQRLATTRQRTAVIARQEGICAAPGCRHRIAEIHHATWWSRGGRTDLDELVGLCGRCHHAVHSGRLHVEPDGRRGFVFRRGAGAAGRAIEDHDRVQHTRISAYLHPFEHPLARTAPLTRQDGTRRRHLLDPRT
ncbi:HNH endonuclease signature motif containing protein [Mumia sp. ZJ430]|uniref:HNH endonuclease n=1 Tax=Mumia sp. ZJ430 TaxID=2708083 RepID=UPI0014236B16|nr:HNH endonuclease signature motif containing protein [Mumia sp. ZJ430]